MYLYQLHFSLHIHILLMYRNWVVLYKCFVKSAEIPEFNSYCTTDLSIVIAALICHVRNKIPGIFCLINPLLTTHIH